MKSSSGFILLEYLCLLFCSSFLLLMGLTGFTHYQLFLNKTMNEIFHTHELLATQILVRKWSKQLQPLICEREVLQDNHQFKLFKLIIADISSYHGFFYLSESNWIEATRKTPIHLNTDAYYLVLTKKSAKIVQGFELGDKPPFRMMQVRKRSYQFKQTKLLIGPHFQVLADGFKNFKLSLMGGKRLHLTLDERHWSIDICTSSVSFF